MPEKYIVIILYLCYNLSMYANKYKKGDSKMKIIVVSDSHGRMQPLERIIREMYADLYIHLGDGERELNEICVANPDKQIYHVRGNCDLASISPLELLISPDDKNVILAVHGHNHGVKHSLEPLKQQARQQGANILLFGHTHARYSEYDNGLYILNPGSVSKPRDGKRQSFGVIDLLPQGVLTNIVDI